MKVSLNWIREYVDLPENLSIEDLACDLTMRTVEVEGWENPARGMQHLLIGRILDVQPHPDADKLRIVQLDVGTERVQIVCGGSNLEPEQLVVAALPGAWVRWHGEGEPVEIKKSKLRGVPSEGMICAAEELSLGGLFPSPSEHFIMDLSDFPGAKEGMELSCLLGFDDEILEIDNKSMTNRPDLWGHYGLARELAAIYGKELRPLPAFIKSQETEGFPLAVDQSADCPRYAVTVWEGLKNGPSPFWIQARLHLLGHTPRNLLVDLSNYVMLATGEPNHVFDKGAVEAGIRVGRAQEGETLTLLDESVCRLSSSDLLIRSGEAPIALAGIMGGKASATRADSPAIVFETAVFDPQLVRKSSQRHELRSDAETRFEKGIDTARVDQALGLMQFLLAKYQPGARLTAHCEFYPEPPQPQSIALNTEWLAVRLGRKLSAEEIETALRPLGFKVCAGETEEEVKVEVPSWRATGDISEKADLLEEIARMIGYENFRFSAPRLEMARAIPDGRPELDRRLREYLAFRCGFQEVFTYPWVHERYQKVCGLPDAESLALAKPPAPEQRFLRASLLPGLIQAAKQNEANFDHFRVFEASQVFHRNPRPRAAGEEILPLQELKLGALIFSSNPWHSFREMKGLLEELPRYVSAETIAFQEGEAPVWADPQVHLDLVTGEGAIIGSFGLLSEAAKDELGFKRGDLCLLELSIDRLKALPSRSKTFTELPQFPAVSMDFSILCDEGLSWSRIEEELGSRVDRLCFLEEYRGKQVPAGKKSLVFRVELSKKDGTLTSDEIDEKRRSLLNRLERKLGAEIRS